MVQHTKIEWADHTFNPWEGCQKVGPGCDNCYAETRNARFSGGQAINWGPGAPRRLTSAINWKKPPKWNADHAAFFAEHGRRQRVFCASLADVFDNAVDPQWRADLFSLIQQTPDLDWLLLTKRIGNVGNMLPVPFDFDKHYPNVWLGATIVNPEEADRDIAKLLSVRAAKHFLSMEPLLGAVHVRDHWLIHHHPGDAAIDWVIVGGESGPGARPMHPEWARSLRDQCEAAGVPFLFKQWGEWVPYEHSAQPPYLHSQHGHEIDGHTLPDFESGDYDPEHSEWCMDWADMLLARKVGKKAAGRLLDGRTWDEAPK